MFAWHYPMVRRAGLKSRGRRPKPLSQSTLLTHKTRRSVNGPRNVAGDSPPALQGRAYDRCAATPVNGRGESIVKGRGSSIPMSRAAKIETALGRVTDQASFLQSFLVDALDWPVGDSIERVERISYGWSDDELRSQGLVRDQLQEGSVWQLQPFHTDQPWGIFLLEFNRPDLFGAKGNLTRATGLLRKVLRGLVPSRRRDPALATWQREHLLFICTHNYEQFRFAYFKAPRDKNLAAPLAFFGWNKGDTHIRTLCEFNLPALAYSEDWNPSVWLTHWTAAFDVEAVTKRFFAEYAEAFNRVEESVKGVPQDEACRLYTQRLMNRLMFLYFIQRKGWLSFGGDKKYLRALFKAAADAKEDFLNDRLYWTFFAGLNTINEDRKVHANVNLKERRGEVPFLNGGLFDLEDEYDVRDKVKIPNAAFAAVLELFERYNFTVTESTPLDVEVAVDPEMLGKVFEELVTGRHETGSYYTPRPIVAFMCRETLKHFLMETVKDEAAVARFVDDGDPSKLPDPETVLNALRSVKVCDPACGSGAYLLGMMQELLRLREALFATKGLDAVTVYKRKLEIIQNNLYGVDIDVFAVNIAKLRLWLSLAVDFEGKTPPPLPNLDFKIECGDSLTAPDPQEIPDLFRALLVQSADRLADLKGEFLSTYGAKKKKLAERIKNEETKLRESLHENVDPASVDWRVAFAEVFRNGGFDVVLGNPPYVRQEAIKGLKPSLKKIYQCYSGVADLFVYFYERGIQLLKPGGQFAFITSNKWYRTGYGEKLRAWLAARTRLHCLIDFGDAPVFEAIAYPTIVVLERRPPGEGASFRALTWQPGPSVENFAAIVRARSFDIPQKSLDKSGWRLEGSAKRNLLDKLRAAGTPLGEYCKGRFYYGIKTGLNDAFVVDRATRDGLIAEHPSSAAVLKPFLRGRDVKRWRVEPQGLWLIFTRHGIDIKKHPAIHRHLKEYKDRLMPGVAGGRKPGSYEWYEIQDNVAYWKEFEKAKIVYPDIAFQCNFAEEVDGLYPDCTLFLIPEAPIHFLPVLNSKCVNYFINQICPAIRGGYRRFKSIYLEQILIPAASPDQQAELEKLVRRIVKARGESGDVTALEAEVNECVYRLFGLTREEIALIEEAK